MDEEEEEIEEVPPLQRKRQRGGSPELATEVTEVLAVVEPSIQ